MMNNMKNKKLDIRLQHHFICFDCTKEEVHKVIFYNSDDNVCRYCGSKNCEMLMQARLKYGYFVWSTKQIKDILDKLDKDNGIVKVEISHSFGNGKKCYHVSVWRMPELSSLSKPKGK